MSTTHIGWMRPKWMDFIKQNTQDCDQLLWEVVPPPYYSEGEIRDTLNWLKSTLLKDEDEFRTEVRMRFLDFQTYRNQGLTVMIPLQIFNLSVWLLIRRLGIPSVLEIELWEPEYSQFPRGIFDDFKLYSSILSGNREKSLKIFQEESNKIATDSHKRDSQVVQYTNHNKGEWLVIFGQDHFQDLKDAQKIEFCASPLTPLDSEKRLISYILNKEIDKIFDPFSPTENYIELHKVLKDLTEGDLQHIWSYIIQKTQESDLRSFEQASDLNGLMSKIAGIYREYLLETSHLQGLTRGLTDQTEKEFKELFRINFSRN